MVEAATANTWITEPKNSASKDEESKAATAKEDSDVVLKFFNEISLMKALKELKKREVDAKMRNEISMAAKCIKIKLNRLSKARGKK